MSGVIKKFGIGSLAFILAAASACGQEEKNIKMHNGIVPGVLADAPVSPIPTDPYVIPSSLESERNIPNAVRLPNPNESLIPFGFIEFTGDPEVPDSAYNNIGPDSYPLDRFRESLYVFDSYGLSSFVDGTLKYAVINDLRSTLEEILTNSGILISDSTVGDLTNHFLRSFYDGRGFDLKYGFLGDSDSSEGYVLFDRTAIVDGTDVQVLSLALMPTFYAFLKRKIDLQSGDAFGGN